MQGQKPPQSAYRLTPKTPSHPPERNPRPTNPLPTHPHPRSVRSPYVPTSNHYHHFQRPPTQRLPPSCRKSKHKRARCARINPPGGAASKLITTTCPALHALDTGTSPRVPNAQGATKFQDRVVKQRNARARGGVFAPLSLSPRINLSCLCVCVPTGMRICECARVHT
ncbi:hypothetical protein P153DRAFT_61037 [Dothidotthia symphoricarpi CBS 119687]|uniref:Uncharacterized protein n=1 Tax=Dothidotthia symphoricarpi CBS 119687 TaxID=1392245 RepID=A0A6A6A8M7_9PLEO|nr:uncharacterized protein P153DRAFT_61037 [Dothidotthia symphoricarpi CBS 119687]KAF2127177.1 hypothetical protein P153DRAFT_61037 [Dothidotthia symphoricarpi CBS 119687]